MLTGGQHPSQASNSLDTSLEPKPSTNMPKTMNIKKAASALNQNQKQIKAALQGASVTFASVEKSLGRAQFLLQIVTENGVRNVTGTPRGLFTAGTMRIAAGQIAIVEGSEKLGFEIVARIDNLSDAQKLVKDGFMPPDVLAAAGVAGALTVVAEEEDDIFDYSEVQEGITEPSMKGGVKGARRQKESLAAAAALATRLGSAAGGMKDALHLEGATDLSAYVGIDEDALGKKAKKPCPASQVLRPPTALAATRAGKEQAVLNFALWNDGVDEEAAVKPVVLARAPECWEDDDAVAIDIDAI